MDIKEIAEQVSKRIYVEDGSLLSKFISEKFAEALIESYKAELLKEVGEPAFGCLYTSGQVAAAILKATKPMEDEVVKWREASRVKHLEAIDWAGKHQAISYELDELRQQLAAAQEEWNQCSGLLDDAHRSIEMLEDQLAKAEQRVAEACADFYQDNLNNGVPFIAKRMRNGEWRKFVKEEV